MLVGNKCSHLGQVGLWGLKEGIMEDRRKTKGNKDWKLAFLT
jgi:hypothetical protein